MCSRIIKMNQKKKRKRKKKQCLSTKMDVELNDVGVWGVKRNKTRRNICNINRTLCVSGSCKYPFSSPFCVFFPFLYMYLYAEYHDEPFLGQNILWSNNIMFIVIH